MTFPTSADTGHTAAGYTSLTNSGALTTTANGQAITGLNIAGKLTINHDNVTVTGCDIHAAGDVVVLINGTGATLVDCTIRGNGTTTATAPDTALVQAYDDDWTLTRCHLYNTSGDGIRYAETSGGLIEDCYLHGWVPNPTNEPHADGVVCGEGQVGSLTIDHSTIIMWQPGHMTDVISMAGGAGDDVHDILVQDSFIAGGGHIAHGGGDGVCSNVKWLGNTIDMNAGTYDGQAYGATYYGLMHRPPTWGEDDNAWSGNMTKVGATLAAPGGGGGGGVSVARNFNGSSDYLTLTASTQVNGSVFGGVFGVVRRANNTNWGGVVGVNRTAEFGSPDSTAFDVGPDADAANNDLVGHFTAYRRTDSVKLLAADGWCIVGFTKPTGTAMMRMHKYVFATDTWTHADASNDDNASTGSGVQSATVTIGRADGVNYWAGDIEVVAIYPADKTDEQVETLSTDLAAWTALSPSGMWVLNQSDVTTAVTDSTVNGSNQSARSGTTVTTGSPLTATVEEPDAAVAVRNPSLTLTIVSNALELTT